MATLMSRLKDSLRETLFEPGSEEDMEMELDDDIPADLEYADEYEEEYEEEPVQKNKRSKVVNMDGKPNLTSVSNAGTMKMVLYQPFSFEEATAIVDNLRARKPVIVNIVDLDRDLAQRVIDFMSGAVYAISGTIRRIAYGIFVVVPSNISLSGEIGEDPPRRRSSEDDLFH